MTDVVGSPRVICSIRRAENLADFPTKTLNLCPNNKRPALYDGSAPGHHLLCWNGEGDASTTMTTFIEGLVGARSNHQAREMSVPAGSPKARLAAPVGPGVQHGIADQAIVPLRSAPTPDRRWSHVQ